MTLANRVLDVFIGIVISAIAGLVIAIAWFIWNGALIK